MVKLVHTLIFRREEKTDWKDILYDPTIKPHIRNKIIWNQSLMIQAVDDFPESVTTYITLKYGDELVDVNKVIPDLTPKMYVDYYPKNPNPKFAKLPNK